MNNEFVPALFGVVVVSQLFYIACDYALLLLVWIAHCFGARVSRLRWTLGHAGAVVGAGMFVAGVLFGMIHVEEFVVVERQHSQAPASMRNAAR